MGKRKRSSEESLEERLEQYKTDLFRALKKVKGFERQRLSRRIREKGIPPERKEKIDLEIAVLKSLDLHHTAYHYLYTSLLKIKSIANHPDLPDVVRREMPKPQLEEKEQAALHHVTSCLFNRLEVRQVMDKVVNEVCGVLRLPPPEKKKGKKKDGKDDGEGEPGAGDRKNRTVDGQDEEKVANKKRTEKERSRDEDKKSKKAPSKEETDSEDEEEGEAPGDEVDTDEEEQAFAKYESFLAGSSEESDADSESESDHIQKGKRRSIRVRGISISLSPEPESAPSSASASASPSASASEVESQSEQSESESESESDAPPAKQPKLSKAKRVRSPDQTFLPTLMGGYVSGSESASDVDVAPRKNRLGQKQRQAIWEKKFGAQAKHVQQHQKRKPKGKGAVRGDGWDLRRGAVDEEGGGRKPWKKGLGGPLSMVGKGAAPNGGTVEKKKPKKDNEGTLHPSWEARKKAKEKEQQQPRRIDMRPAGGNKIVFDD